jgi:glycosyltransferase involved in cell wall biosynthesis
MGAAMADPRHAHVTVCYIRDRRDGIFAIDTRARDARVDYVEVRERHSFDPQVWSQLRTLVAERQIDVVHAHEYKTNLLALLLSKACGVTALSTVHGWTGHSPRERYFYYPADKRVLAKFPRLIAVSTDIANELIEHGAAPERITTVLNAIDANAFRRDPAKVADARAQLHLQQDQIAIGAVGRLEPQKRFDLLLDAFAVLHQRNPKLHLIIAGDGSLRKALDDQRRELGIAGAVTLAGHVTNVVALHHAFDLFVQSSDYEGTPNSVLEAMAMETPVVATEAGGTAELVHDGIHGRIIPVGRGDKLMHAINAALLDRGATRRMTARARQRVEGELSFETRVRKVEGIYRELLGSAPPLKESYA